MKYNILQFSTNTKDQYYADVIATFDNLDGAKVKYHQTLASLNNADDVKVACVKIVTMYGYDVQGFSEIVDHSTTEESEQPS